MAEGSQPGDLEQVIDKIISLGEDRDTVAVSDMQDCLGQRSFGPFLFVPAIIEISPIGGVPGVPTLLALIVALFAIQMLFGREHFWVPGFLSHRAVSAKKLEKGLNKIRPATGGWTKSAVSDSAGLSAKGFFEYWPCSA